MDEVRNMIRSQNITVIDFLPLKKLMREKMKWNESFRSNQVLSLYKRMLGLNQ
jgi:hypothetical protein